MRKLAIILIIFSFFISICSNSYAKTVSQASINSIKYTTGKTQDQITVYTSSYIGWKAFYLPDPDRLVVDLPNNKIALKNQKAIKVNGLYMKAARYSQFTKTSSRLVFDLTGKLPYSVQQNKGSITFTLKKPTKATPVSTGVSRGGVDRGAPPTQPISYSSTADYDKLAIPTSDYSGYKIMRLTGPDRIVIDIPKYTVSPNQQIINAGSSLTKDIRISQTDSSGRARIVVDTEGQPQYHMDEGLNQLILTIEKATYKNLLYTNNNDRTYFSVTGVNLPSFTDSNETAGTVDGTSAEAADFKTFFSGQYDETGRFYTVSFPSNVVELGSGNLQINDGLMNNVEIVNDTVNQKTNVTFNTEGKFAYEFSVNTDLQTLEISVSKLYSLKDRLVVIDAGHGGNDPGATSSGINEKDINLKIAVKVNEILQGKGVNTYMTRVDDTFVPLRDRANIANNMIASLFLSIHNNAYNKSEHGTETLYYPTDASKSFAKTVQDSLTNALGTKNRGIVDRPNLVVLNSTKMPAVIAEVAFVTNDEDHAKLLDDNFLQNAAQALANAVIKTLGF
jgi:N-acetylmuramoyl-L-alanine amidase